MSGFGSNRDSDLLTVTVPRCLTTVDDLEEFVNLLGHFR
jgi:hypothetical protein